MRKFVVLLVSLLAMPSVSAQVIVAHRGASYAAPENTLAAFKLAWEELADGVEGDFYFTRDQQIVCIHDADTKRTAGIKKVVAESTLEELRQLEYGEWKDAKFAGEPIPTFAEVLQSVPEGKQFIIELKTGPEVVPLLKREIDRLQPDLSKLWIISFKADTIAQCKQVLPSVKAHWLTGFKQDRLDGSWHPSVEQVAETLAKCQADGLGVQGRREVVNEAFIDQLRSSGLTEFHVWTIDDPVDAEYFQRLGACGITTNKPLAIRQSLKLEPKSEAAPSP